MERLGPVRESREDLGPTDEDLDHVQDGGPRRKPDQHRMLPLRPPGHDRDHHDDEPDQRRDPSMEDVRGGQFGQWRDEGPAHQRPVREDQGRIDAAGGHVRAEHQQGECRDRAERGEEREPLARAPAADPCGVPGPDRHVDEEPDEGHGRGQVRRHRLAGVAESDRLAPEPRLEPDQKDGADGRPQDRAAVPVVLDREDREPEDLEPDDDRHAAMDPLDPGFRVVERREDLAVTEGPVRAAQTGVRRAHHDADRDQRERGHESRQGKALVAGHETAILSRRRRIPARRDTLSAMPSLRLLVAVSLLAVVAAACGSTAPTTEPAPASAEASAGTGARCATAPAPASMEGWSGPAQMPSVFPLLVSDRITCGPARILLSLLDSENRPVATPDRTLSVTFYDLGKDPTTPATTVDGAFTWAIEGERGLYILDADLPEAGTWGAEIHTQAPGGPAETIRSTFEVLADSSIVHVGDPAPATETPTLADVGGDATRISTDATPDPAFYETSVADALAAKRPFILVFATPKFCTSAQCGPTLDRIKPIAAANPDVTFINVEPYQLQEVEGQLQPVLDANGQLQATDVTDAWGLWTEPWIFAVDAEGIVRGSYGLIATEDEIEGAIDTITGRS